MLDGNNPNVIEKLKLSMKDFESESPETFKDYASRMIGDNETGKKALD